MASGNYNNFPSIAKKLPQVVSQLVRKAAFDIEGDAKSGAPVDTGFMKASVYTVTDSSSGYSAAEEEAHAANPKAVMLPEVATPADAYTAMVAVGAEYAAYVEYGTVHMGAQPFFTPAVESNTPKFVAAMQQLESKLK